MIDDHGYKLPDEPEPSALARFAVRPFWPFLALMLGGAWIAWPWFVLNAYALGSPTREKERKLVLGALAASTAVALALTLLVELELIGIGAFRYLLLILIVVKLGFGYALHTMGSRTIPLYEHFGGALRNGLYVVIAASVLRSLVLTKLPLFLILVLA